MAGEEGVWLVSVEGVESLMVEGWILAMEGLFLVVVVSDFFQTWKSKNENINVIYLRQFTSMINIHHSLFL